MGVLPQINEYNYDKQINNLFLIELKFKRNSIKKNKNIFHT